MQIIVIPDRLARARTLNVSARHLLASLAAAGILLIALTAALYWVTFRFATDIKIPLVRELVLSAQQGEAERARKFVQQNLNAMAVKLGEMQAQLARLDALGDRVSAMAGIRPQEFRFTEAPGLGGAQPTALPPQNLSLAEFGEKLYALSRSVENRTDMLGVLETRLFEETIKKKMMPTSLPVSAPYNASSFGMRIDPFTGMQAMHEGIDFLADLGSPVTAAAGGVVTFAGFHPQYGNVVDVDHGNDLVTRYAHLAKLLVKEGDIVQRLHRLGLSGSTGRSTGPHLHFEVRFRGVAQNPTRFLFALQGTQQAARSGR